MKTSPFFRTILLLLAVLSVGLTSAERQVFAEFVDIQVANARSALEYDGHPGAEVISLEYHANEVAEGDGEPRLRIYGDGTAVIHYPAYMKKAGNYMLQLTNQEMVGLFQAILKSGILAFNRGWVEQRKAQIEEKRRAQETGEPAMLYEVADADIVQVVCRLKRYAPQGFRAGAQTDFEKRIVYEGLQTDVERYPQIGALKGLRTIEQLLLSLTQRKDLVKIAE
jgi:hypothetical protein